MLTTAAIAMMLKRILSWSEDKTLRWWDVATGQQIGPAMNPEFRFPLQGQTAPARRACRDLGTRPELRTPNVAAQTRIVSVASSRVADRS
jgi:hypothetical protein